MNNYIEIIDENDKKVKAKLLLQVTLEETNKNYIVYQIGDEVYASRYNESNGIEYLDLDNNLTEEEFTMLEKLMDVQNENK